MCGRRTPMLTLLYSYKIIKIICYYPACPQLIGTYYGNLFFISNILALILKHAWSELSAVTSSKPNRGDQYMQRKKNKRWAHVDADSIQIGSASHPWRMHGKLLARWSRRSRRQCAKVSSRTAGPTSHRRVRAKTAGAYCYTMRRQACWYETTMPMAGRTPQGEREMHARIEYACE